MGKEKRQKKINYEILISITLFKPLFFSSLLISSLLSLLLPSSPLYSLFLWGLLSTPTVTSVPSLPIFGAEMRGDCKERWRTREL